MDRVNAQHGEVEAGKHDSELGQNVPEIRQNDVETRKNEPEPTELIDGDLFAGGEGSGLGEADGFDLQADRSDFQLDSSDSGEVSTVLDGSETDPTESDHTEEDSSFLNNVGQESLETDSPVRDGSHGISPEDIRGALEAILMVVSEPVSTRSLAQVLGISEAVIDSTLRGLAAEYRGETGPRRGFELREAGEGWRMYSSPRYAEIVGSFVTFGHTARLSGPALETLAVIAYRQPVTRAQVAEIRGVNVDGVVRTLMTRGLVEATGQEGTGAVLYGTTGYFLEKMGMTSLAELPPASPHLPELDELDDIEKDRQ